ncbi:hypothetical protein ACFQ48_09505 [Hymenobacter caeli]|uniref:Hemagglutinin n=1 Tax=Hymenobacter caeli TaxID=2735894 RepID=A0ABX2FPH0_9BACT|nr:hypothetical protein [Hymenobacter caeli]NRT18305.1 hypothetical protein [Hymenobacter caeli]
MLKLPVFLLVGALAVAACSPEREAESTAATPAYPVSAAAATPAVSALDTVVYRTEADVLAVRVARELHITDPALLTRIKNEYYARGRVLGGYATRYAADTAGRYAAVRAANNRTSQHLRTALTPGQYQTYAARQGTYYARSYTDVQSLAPLAPTLSPGDLKALGIKKLQSAGGRPRGQRDEGAYHKVKYLNGAKIKRNADGSLKIRQADGTKIKIDKNGRRTVKTGLF